MPMTTPTFPATLSAAVPLRYQGVWQRILFENAQQHDTSSLVLWMQSQHYHIDLRIPTQRGTLSQVTALAEYSEQELLQLASQQGFAGITQVSSNICQWQREMDFQPENGTRDIAKMAFDGLDTLLETGIDSDYLEIWKKLADSHTPCQLQMSTGNCRDGSKVPAYLMQAGKWMAFARPRKVSVPNANSMLGAIAQHQPSREVLLDWLDMEISFGECLDEEHWRILHSSLPFKEQVVMKLPHTHSEFNLTQAHFSASYFAQR
jgi:hypothetical protein